MARQSLLLVRAAEPGFSKLGGDPELPDGVAWPEVRGRPCAFVAQIDLSALPRDAGLNWLPGTGLLYAFVDLEGYGFADQVQVRLDASAAGEPRSPPARGLRFPERRIGFEPHASLPSLDWLGVDPAETDLTDDQLDEIADLSEGSFGSGVQHRIGGYPSEIQGEQMRLSCELSRRGLEPLQRAEVPAAVLRASKSWRLLLQIDSDPDLKMNWGDGGRLYVFVREQDARAGDVSRTVTIFQTY